MLIKEDKWQIVFPKQGNYMYITLTSQVVSVVDWLRRNYESKKIEAISFAGADKMPLWKFKNDRDITSFYHYLRAHFGSGNLKIRVKAK